MLNISNVIQYGSKASIKIFRKYKEKYKQRA